MSLPLTAERLRLSYGDLVVADQLSTQIPVGKITSIIGPNGCGKSTLLRALSRLHRPAKGQVLLGGRPLPDYPRRELARLIGLLPQSPTAPEGITVADLVGRGRHPHQGLFGRWNERDYQVVAQALETTGVDDFAERSVDELSGGQRQRVWIAMTLAQETGIMLLDEPTTFLDIANQLEVLDLLADLNREQGTTIAMVLHDVNLAARYSDHLIAMRDGKIVAAGKPRDVITEPIMTKVFGVDCEIATDPVTNTPLVVPRGRHHS